MCGSFVTPRAVGDEGGTAGEGSVGSEVWRNTILQGSRLLWAGLGSESRGRTADEVASVSVFPAL